MTLDSLISAEDTEGQNEVSLALEGNEAELFDIQPDGSITPVEGFNISLLPPGPIVTLSVKESFNKSLQFFLEFMFA